MNIDVKLSHKDMSKLHDAQRKLFLTTKQGHTQGPEQVKINVLHHVYTLEKESHVIIPTDAENLLGLVNKS